MTNQWMPQEQWDTLSRDGNCPFCSLVKGDGEDYEWAYYVTDLSVSRLYMMKNQYYQGYCGLVCFNHLHPPYEPPFKDMEEFKKDMETVTSALAIIFRAKSVDFRNMNAPVFHLHSHFEPHQDRDFPSDESVNPNAEPVYLEPEEYRDKVREMGDFISILLSKDRR